MATKQTILINDVILPNRHRKDFGDLQALADSIDAEGLLQPIGINPDNKLVFGERRLRAVRDILGWDRVDCRIVNVSSLVAGEYAENEIRKDFTPMERVAIGRALEAEIGKRKPGPKGNGEMVSPGTPSKGKTRDHVAKAVGFKSGSQFERAKKVDDKGSQALKDAVDRGDLDVTTASKLVDLPKKRQTEIVKGGKSEARRIARDGDVPKAKPPREYPVSDQFIKWAESLGGFCTNVKVNYGSIAEMLADSGWDAKRTVYAGEILRSAVSSFTKLNKEFQECRK